MSEVQLPEPGCPWGSTSHPAAAGGEKGASFGTCPACKARVGFKTQLMGLKENTCTTFSKPKGSITEAEFVLVQSL